MMLQTQNKEKIMTINLGKGFYDAIRGHSSLTGRFRERYYPLRGHYDYLKDMSRLPPINEAYETMLRENLNNDQIIALLIKMYFPLKFFRVGKYENMVMVVGFIGPRGSGKSCSAAMVGVCDFMVRGLPLWSNMDIRVRVCYRDVEKVFESQPLDDLDLLDLTGDFGGGAVLVDEINLEAMEATRHMSAANLAFANVMQQVRKRSLSVLFSCQGWNWLDSRLRWQSDAVVACRDAIFEKDVKTNGIGDTCIWRVHDLSGTSGRFDYDFELKHRYLTDYLVKPEKKVWIRPWWDCYRTDQLFGQEDYVTKYKTEQKARRQTEADKLNKPIDNSMIVPEISNTVTEYVEACYLKGITDIPCKNVWRVLGVDDKDRSSQTIIGNKFNKYYTRKRKSDGYHYILKEEYTR